MKRARFITTDHIAIKTIRVMAMWSTVQSPVDVRPVIQTDHVAMVIPAHAGFITTAGASGACMIKLLIKLQPLPVVAIFLMMKISSSKILYDETGVAYCDGHRIGRVAVAVVLDAGGVVILPGSVPVAGAR